MRTAGGRTEQRKDYAAIRGAVTNGDLLLFQGKSWTSKVIRWFTRSKYSHVGVAMWWRPTDESPRRLMIFEAVRQGVVCSPASKAVDHYSGQVDWYTLEAKARDAIRTDQVFAMCLEGLGRRFGYLGFVRYAWRWLLAKLGVPMTGGREQYNARAMFCSWYVSEVFAKAGYDLDREHVGRLTSPSDIARAPATVYAGTIHWDRATAAGRLAADAGPASAGA